MAGMMVGTASYVPPEACLSNQLSQRIHSGRISRRQEAESAGSPLQAVMAHLPVADLGQKAQLSMQPHS